MLKRIYQVFGLLTLSLLAIATARGWELGSAKQEQLPQGVRQSPGGYRSFHFWHSGYQGGK